MIQPIQLEMLLDRKFNHLKINDELGFTEEYRMSIKSIIDLLIDIENKDFECDKCKGVSSDSIQCENPSCPNMPCCNLPREKCDCVWGDKISTEKLN